MEEMKMAGKTPPLRFVNASLGPFTQIWTYNLNLGEVTASFSHAKTALQRRKRHVYGNRPMPAYKDQASTVQA